MSITEISENLIIPELRNCAVHQFKNLLSCNTDIAMEIEQVLYDITSEGFTSIPKSLRWDHEEFRKVYKDKLYAILSNLLMTYSSMKTELSNNLHSYESIYTILTKDMKLFVPSIWSELIMSRNNIQEPNVVEELRLESQIECYRCKKAGKYANNVETTQVQTRSADEPMTIFCLCRGCGQRWRM